MAVNMSREEALKLLNLHSALELTVGHVEKMIDADPSAKENIFVESDYWEAFHLLKQERDNHLKKEFETNRAKDKAKVKQEINPKSLAKTYDLEKTHDSVVGYQLRRELSELVYAINNKEQFEAKYPEEIKWLEKRKQDLAKLFTYQKEMENQNSKLSEDIIEFEKKIAAINNDKSGAISSDEKGIEIARIKKHIVDLKSKRLPKSQFNEREVFLCQQALANQESKCEDIKLKIEQWSSELLKYSETVKIYSLVETSERIYFIGPFSGSRAISGVNYASGYSELGESLRGMKKGEIASYNGQSLEILNISIPDLRWLQGLVTPANWEEDFLTVLPDWSPLGWDLRYRTSRPELWSRSPGFSNNSRHLTR